MNRQLTAFLASLTSLCICLFLSVSAHAGTARYVFLFIGDGMGQAQRNAAELYTGRQLLMDGFPVQGVTTTHAADRSIPCSAASATALGSAQKTNVGMLGMAPDRTPVMSIAELARGLGMRVGIVSTVPLNHATPAAFYAHVPSRAMFYDIALALAESDFDLFMGGGIRDPENLKDNAVHFMGNALDVIRQAGYSVVTDRAGLLALTPESGKVLAWNTNLFEDKAMPYSMEMDENDVSLSEYTAKAIELLDNEDGFFLMVEGGKIDWACHANDGAAAVTDLLAFDQAVAEAVAFYRIHPEDTLIVVTGDHESGGLDLAGTSHETCHAVLSAQTISFRQFATRIVTPFQSDFEAMKPLITRHFGLLLEGDAENHELVLNDIEIRAIKAAFEQSMLGMEERDVDAETARLYGGYDPLTMALTHILDHKAGLDWSTYGHTEVPVVTSALGAMAESFNGHYDNTDVALKIMEIMGIEARVHTVSSFQTPQALSGLQEPPLPVLRPPSRSGQ